MKNETNSSYLTVRDISEYLNISKSQAYELTHRKDFPVSRFGGAIRIPAICSSCGLESRPACLLTLLLKAVARGETFQG